VTENPAYETMAEEYAAGSERNAWNSLYERPATIALLPPVAGKHVLDVGCGSAPLSAWLVDHGASVAGIDASAAMIRIAERRALPNASFRVTNLADPLPFADGTFDIAVASLVLHYLEDWLEPLRELRRVLRAAGTLVLSTHHPSWDVTLSDSGDYFATELIQDCWERGGRPFEVTYWRRPLTAMVAAMRSAGFRIDTIEEPFPLEECRERFPEDWQKLTTRPAFLFFRLVASS
jgi:SAM-dependent methyltransferase